MRYRLPLELELTILELAAPPLAYASLHARVDFFIKISLVHGSLTAWAQDKLRDQFLYTYRRRPDEHDRLKRRFEAGFGRDRPLRRLYLDLTRLPSDIHMRRGPGTDSVSATINGQVLRVVYPISGPCYAGEGGAGVQGQACDAVAHFAHPEEPDPLRGHWQVCTMVAAYSQTIRVLWLKLPIMKLDISNLPRPRVLYVDDDTHRFRWAFWRLLPISSETVLYLQSMVLAAQAGEHNLEIHHLILDECWVLIGSLSDFIGRLRHLETLVVFETEDHDLVSTIIALPTSNRRVHVLQHGIEIKKKQRTTRKVLPRLKFFAFTLLPPSAENVTQTPTGNESDPLLAVQQQIAETVVAPQCTFKYIRSTKSPEDALADARADAMADLGLDS